MAVTALGSLVAAETFVIASEPAPAQQRECRTGLSGGAEDHSEPAYLYSMRRCRLPIGEMRISGDPAREVTVLP